MQSGTKAASAPVFGAAVQPEQNGLDNFRQPVENSHSDGQVAVRRRRHLARPGRSGERRVQQVDRIRDIRLGPTEIVMTMDETSCADPRRPSALSFTTGAHRLLNYTRKWRTRQDLNL